MPSTQLLTLTTTHKFAPQLVFINTTTSAGVGAEVGFEHYDIEEVVIPDLVVSQCGCH